VLENIIPEDYPDFEEHGTPPCAESFPDAFFTTEKSESAVLKNGKMVMKTWARYDYEQEAKAICAECPYKKVCLEFAIKHWETGIWGGTTDLERKRMRTARNLGSTSQPRPRV
jgi:sulfatase maturation enzyme AslB (radical SAM superfamily)